jgi:phage gpG-like protein
MIEVTVPNTEQLQRDLGITRARLLVDLKREITRVAIDVSAHIKDRKLSGQVLKVQTGRLRRSINYKIGETGTGIEARVGTNVEYARIHEFGFSGTVNVREHMRKAKKAYTVKAHTRRVNLPERSFMRSSMKDMRQDIDQRIARVVGQAIAKGNGGAVA